MNTLDAEGLAAASDVCDRAFARLRDGSPECTAVLTGHAHIDLVWLWPERCGDYKLVHIYSLMDASMNEYPELVFGASLLSGFEAVRRRSPALLERLGSRISAGRFECVGGAWVESDTHMACGEALLRGLLIGQKTFQQLTGEPSKVMWLPDAFGYSAASPQLLRGAGMECFFTTKLTWSNINRFPYSSFVWVGLDGSEVLVHIPQASGYNQNATPQGLIGGALQHRQADLHDEFLAPTGFGDGGGGVTREICQRARRLTALRGIPTVRWGRIDTFFEKLNGLRGLVAHWRGELYPELHRATFTTHHHLKQAFRDSEVALQTWEAVRCVTGGGPIPEENWQRVVFAQFHDYNPGSSVSTVYTEGVPELRSIAKTARETAAAEISDPSGPEAPFNPLAHELTWLDTQSDQLSVAPALTRLPISDAAHVRGPISLDASERGLLSDRVTLSFDAAGKIAELTFDGVAVPWRAPGACFTIQPDFPACFDAWDIDYQNAMQATQVDCLTQSNPAISRGNTLPKRCSATLSLLQAARRSHTPSTLLARSCSSTLMSSGSKKMPGFA